MISKEDGAVLRTHIDLDELMRDLNAALVDIGLTIVDEPPTEMRPGQYALQFEVGVETRRGQKFQIVTPGFVIATGKPSADRRAAASPITERLYDALMTSLRVEQGNPYDFSKGFVGHVDVPFNATEEWWRNQYLPVSPRIVAPFVSESLPALDSTQLRRLPLESGE